MIEVKSLSKRFGATLAVDDLSFIAQPGSVLGFLGPNGAGKTTTLRVLLGLARASSGSATIDGRGYAQLADPTGTVGAVLDSSGFHPGRRGRNHLRVIARAAGLPQGRVEEVLGLVELSEAAERRVGGYSLGMKQRLNLAGALLGDPEVLILDEPANGLDPQGIRWLRDLLRAMAAEGRTVLVSSHVLSEVEQTVDQVVVISRGRLRIQSTLDELRSRRGGTSVLVSSPQAGRLRGLLEAAGASVAPDGEDSLRAGSISTARVGEIAAEAGVVLHELSTREDSSLEEVFLELTATEGDPTEGDPAEESAGRAGGGG